MCNKSSSGIPSDGEEAKLRLYAAIRALSHQMPESRREDLAQEAALKILRSSRDFEEIARLDGYAWVVLQSVYANDLASEKRTVPLREEDLEVSDCSHDCDGELNGYLSFLGPLDAEILCLRYLDGRSVPEIAAEFASQGRTTSKRQVESRLKRARRRFVKVLRLHGLVFVGALLTLL